MTELTSRCADAATAIFNLPDYRVLETERLGFGQRRIHVESSVESGWPDCGVIGTRRHSRRRQRVRDIPVAGPVEVLWSKRRFFCDESDCPRRTFFEGTVEVPRLTRFTGRLRNMLVSAVIDSGRAATAAASAHGVSWRLVQRALNMAATRLPDVDKLRPRLLGIDERRFRSVRFFKDRETKVWKRFEPWRTTIVDPDTGQVLGVVDGRDHKGLGEWLFKRPFEWRLGVQVVAIDPSAAFRKAFRMWLPRTVVSVGAFHLVLLGNNMLTEVRQRLTQETRCRRGRTSDPVWANRRLLPRAGESLSDRGRDRLSQVFDLDDPPRHCPLPSWSHEREASVPALPCGSGQRGSQDTSCWRSLTSTTSLPRTRILSRIWAPGSSSREQRTWSFSTRRAPAKPIWLSESARAGHRVLFDTAAGCVSRLAAAHDRGRLPQKLAKLRRYKLLIVEEVGHIPFDQDSANLFFQLVSSRYEHASLALTSNLAFSRWAEVFSIATVASAMIDGMVHHAEVLNLTGSSLGDGARTRLLEAAAAGTAR